VRTALLRGLYGVGRADSAQPPSSPPIASPPHRFPPPSHPRSTEASSRDAARVLVLANGCLCCSTAPGGRSGDELARTLDKLVALGADGIIQGEEDGGGTSLPPPPPAPTTTTGSGVAGLGGAGAPPVAASSPFPFDAVVIETSGLVDPSPLVQTFHRAAINGARYYLDGVVAVVDAKHVRHHLDGTGFLSRAREAGQQVAYADLVLLNKCDAATPEELAAAETAVRACNPVADVRRTVFCAVGADEVLGRRGFDVRRAGALLEAQLLLDGDGDGDGDGGRDAAGGGGGGGGSAAAAAARTITPRHTSGIRAVTIDASGVAVPSAVLLEWLRGLVLARWQDLFRVKGLLRVYDEDEDEGSGGEDGAGEGVEGEEEEEAVTRAAAARPRSRGRQRAGSGGAPSSAAVASTRVVKATPAAAVARVAPSYLFAVHGVHADLQGVRMDGGEEEEVGGGGGGAGSHSHSHRHVHPALVLIGRNLQAEALQAEFRTMVAAKGRAVAHGGGDGCGRCEAGGGGLRRRL
jgi:G3E family GTPase